MIRLGIVFLVLVSVGLTSLRGQVPHLINYQGRITTGGTNFDGDGRFKFALVNEAGDVSYWSNDGTSTAGGEPSAAVTLPVSKGLYSVLLGDTTLTSMSALPAAAFSNAAVFLRVWFNDGSTGFQKLVPDRRIAAVGYALMAESVADGAVTAAKIAPGAIDSTHLAPGLTLGGVTMGTFNGGLTGNITGSAASFTGVLAGDVTGTQGATVVGMVGGSTAANVHAGEVLANGATAANTAGTLVKRDGTSSFAAGSIVLSGGLSLPATTGAGLGTISQNGAPLVHTAGTNNFFAGANAGNFALTGSGNVALGTSAGSALTTGSNNILIGNAGVAAESSTVRIGAPGTHAHTYLSGVIHGDGSGLTGVTVAAAYVTGTISGSQIASGAVGANQLADDAVGSTQIAAGAVTSIHLATGSVGSSQIATGAVGGTKIAAGAVSSVQIADGAVGANQLAAGAVGSTQIAAGAVTSTHLAAGSVGSSQIATGAVGTTQIANGAVTSAQLANGAVGTSQLAEGAVGSTQLANGAAAANLLASGLSGVVSGGVVLSAVENPALVSAGYVKIGTTDINTNAPVARSEHSAVWTGSEMIVWGGNDNGATTTSTYTDTGGRFEPASQSWAATSTTSVPTARRVDKAVWTGSEMIFFGGYDGVSSSSAANGGRYRPSTNTWVPMSTSGAPSDRALAYTVWTGTEMLVWGGMSGATSLNTGGRYTPGTNTWASITTTNAPAGRQNATAVWTGSVLIVWGGYNPGSNTYFNTGARYNPATDTWTPTSTAGAPSARSEHAAVWTGSQMIVCGGYDASNAFVSGGRYNPMTDTWTSISTVNAEGAPRGASVVWTGSEMIIWGGRPSSSTPTYTGTRYNPLTNQWTSTSFVGTPAAREEQTAVWTGSEMIVWGGKDINGKRLNDGGSYNPTMNTWTPLPAKRVMYLYQKP